MAKTNFGYEKRQRELEKKRKAEEKARRKQELKREPGDGSVEPEADSDSATDAGAVAPEAQAAETAPQGSA